jgi:hypothetical protein
MRLILSCLAMTPAIVAAQDTLALRRAAGSIDQDRLRASIELIAHDSMGGRDSPSPGLDKTAAWMGREFQRLGLAPGGDSGGYLQRFPIHVAAVDQDSVFLLFTGPNDERILLRAGPDLIVQGTLGNQPKPAEPVLIGGPVTAPGLATASLRDKVVIWIADWTKGPPAGAPDAVQAILSQGPRGVVAVVNSDSIFVGFGGGGPPPGPIVELGPPPPPGPAGQAPFLALVAESRLLRDAPEVGATLAELRSAPTGTVTPVPEWRATTVDKRSDPVLASLPNVVGILEGSDPRLRREYLVVSAHLDHVGSRCAGVSPSDQICNGADDDASGIAAVVEVARAFAEPGARPKRSVIFLGVSGEERGLWGSEHFAANPPVDLKSIVANLNMDMIGRNWKDTIVAIGRVHSDLGPLADRVAADHPELGLTVVDDLWPEENLYLRSDHYNFARRGVPILFFTSGLHRDYHAVTDSPEKIDVEKEARIVKLVFYLSQAIANRSERPAWRPESYRQIVKPIP